MQCARCRRDAPPQDSDAFLEWETDATGEAVVCPGCLTWLEENALADDAAATAADAAMLTALEHPIVNSDPGPVPRDARYLGSHLTRPGDLN